MSEPEQPQTASRLAVATTDEAAGAGLALALALSVARTPAAFAADMMPETLSGRSEREDRSSMGRPLPGLSEDTT